MMQMETLSPEPETEINDKLEEEIEYSGGEMCKLIYYMSVWSEDGRLLFLHGY